MAMSQTNAVSFTNPLFIAGRPEDVSLQDAPINPDWIVSGSPRARIGLHSPSTDRKASTHIWECTAGSFWWTFYDEETVVIIEGAVTVMTPEGETRVLLPGDIAYFAPGTRALWTIDNYVRKIAFCRQAVSPTRMLRTMLGRMRRAATGRTSTAPAIATIVAALPI